MKYYFIFLFVIISKLGLTQQLASPEVICSAGGFNEINGKLQVSWTLGELHTETFTNSNFIFTSGFQQESYSIEIEPDGINYKDYFNEFEYFPNPFQNYFNLKLSFDTNDNYKLIIFSEEGKKILIQNLTCGVNQVYIQNYHSQLLFATIFDSKSTKIISFKIHKQ